MKKILSFMLAAMMLVGVVSVSVAAENESVYVNPEFPFHADFSEPGAAEKDFFIDGFEKQEGFLVGYKDTLAFQSKFAFSSYDVSYEMAIAEDEQVAEGAERYFTFSYINPNTKHNGITDGNVNMNFTIDITNKELWLFASPGGFGIDKANAIAGPVALDIDTELGTLYKFGVSVSEGRMRYFIDDECLIDYIDEENKYYIGYGYAEVEPSIMLWWSVNNCDMYKSVTITESGEQYPFPVPIMYGDTNSDGAVNVADVTLVLKHIAKWSNIDINIEAADVKYDGVINVSDATQILKYIAKWSGIILGPNDKSEADIGDFADFTVKTVTTAWELANRAAYIAENYDTLYVMGCFGAPMSDSNKEKYTANHTYNEQAERVEMINGASSDTFGFDCSGLIKGILWGWSGELDTNYGGASYASANVPDFSSDSTEIYADGTLTADWSSIEIGEAVWMPGHIGIYIGGGLAVECTPAWENKVQITAVGNIGEKEGFSTRTWAAHGKLKYVSYTGESDTFNETVSAVVTYTVKSGDTLSGIAGMYGTTANVIAHLNGIADANKIFVGQELKIPQ